MRDVVKCDITGQLVRLNDGVLVVDKHTGHWYFCAREAEDQVPNKSNFPPAVNLNDQASLISLLAYLGNKPWFDAGLFFQKIVQLKPQSELP